MLTSSAAAPVEGFSVDSACEPFRPIRLFGDPVLRTPAGHRSWTFRQAKLRTLVRGPDPRNDGWRAPRGGAGRSADRGGPGEVFTYHVGTTEQSGHSDQPGAALPVRTRIRTAEEGVPVHPRFLKFDCRRREQRGRALGQKNQYGDPITSRWHGRCWARLRAARDRSPWTGVAGFVGPAGDARDEEGRE